MRFLLAILLFSLSTDLVAQSNTRIFPDTKKIFNRNGRKGYNLERLFDGDTLTKIDGTGGISDNFSTPWESWIILDSFYNNLKLQSFQETGGGGFVVTLLTDDGDDHMIESNGWLDPGDSLGSFNLTVTAFRSWVTNNSISGFTNVRALRFKAATYGDKTAGIWEVKLFGDVQGVAPTIYRSETITPNSDPGKYGHGMGLLDDKNTDTARKMAWSFRVGYSGPTLDSETVNRTLPLLDANFVYKYDRFGTNYFNTRIFNTARTNNIKVQNYFVGGNIKNLTSTQAATYNFNTWALANDYKYMEPGADSTTLSAWAGYARFWKQYAGLFGTNTSFDLSGYKITGMTKTAGQGGVEALEIGNEYTKDWKTSAAFWSPAVMFTMMDTVTRAIKEVDASINVYVPACTFIDTVYVKALFFENYLRYGTTRAVPWDGFCFNAYINNAYDGQQTDAAFFAITPERWKLKDRLAKLGTMLDRLFPNHSNVRITEFGFSSDNVSSGFDVPAISGKTREQTKGDWALRYKELACVGGTGYLQRTFYYWYSGDGSGTFDKMNATMWDGTKDTMMPVGKLLCQQKTSEENYNFWATTVTDGDSTAVWVTRRNATTGTNKLFTIWKATYNNSTSPITINLGEGAATATLKTTNYNTTSTTNTSLTITDNQVTVTASEVPQWIEVTYSEAENENPTAVAGADQEITLPTDEVSVNGGSSTDSDGEIVTYEWTKISGPATYNITDPNAASTTITDLVEGVYVFRLTVTDDDGATGTDDIQITVNAAPAGPPTNIRQYFRGTLRNKFRNQ